MTSITKLKTAQSIQFFEPGVALGLLQAFHRHLDLEALLTLFYSQASAVLQTAGMAYRNVDQNIDLMFEAEGRHTASYNLTYQEQMLGELVFHFDRRVNEDTLATAEDLAALVMSPINNALKHRAALQAAGGLEATLPTDSPAPAAASQDDSLILLKLDGLEEIRHRDGEEWAQTLVASVQSQLKEGLRDADGVFQIDEALLAVLLPRTTPRQATDVAAKLRILISSLHLKNGEVSQQLTACMGISGTRYATSAETVLDQARAALDAACAEGPNHIRNHQRADADD